MNRKNYKKILLTILFLLPFLLLSTAKTANASTTKSYNFNTLTCQSSYNALHWPNSDTILLNGQYSEIDYNLPETIDMSQCNSITYSVSSPSGKTALKLYDESGKEIAMKSDIHSFSNTDFTFSLDTSAKVSKIGIINLENYLCCVIAHSISFAMEDSTSDSSPKLAAITFDDGPSTTTTPQILDILERYNTKATFFLIGEQINNETIPIMKNELRLGCEIANHSWSHSYMDKMTADEVKDEVENTSKAIKDAVGTDVKFFRPPYIAVSNTMYDNISLGFICGMGCNDWDSSYSADYRVNTILDGVTDGTIILLHDFSGNDNTVEALPKIIEGLKEKGYKLVTVSELFEEKGVNPLQKNKLWTTIK